MNPEKMNIDEVMKARMEQIAPTYDKYMKRITLGNERRLRLKTLEAAGIKAGDHFLEVGCGTGTLTLEARRQVGPAGSASGIDIIPLMIALSREKAAKAGLDATFQVAGMHEIPYPDNSFDLVVGSFMIFHMSEARRQKGISEIFRVLKPGGRLLFLDAAWPPEPWRRAFLQKILRFKLDDEIGELRAVMQANGFVDIEVKPFDIRILGFSMLGCIRGNARKTEPL